MVKARRQAVTWTFTAACVAAASFAGSSVPAGAASGAAVCGLPTGNADAVYNEELQPLGRDHACDHLKARKHRTSSTRPVHHASADSREASTAAVASTDPAVVGTWSSAANPGTKTVAITSVLLHTGKVLMFGGKYRSTDKNTAAYVFDPVTRTGHEVPAPAAVYCGGITVLSDGRVISVGGANPVPKGIIDVYLFDPISERWIRQPDSPLGRYYPTTTKLGDGRVVVVAGDTVDGSRNPNVELFTPPLPGSEVGTLEVVGDAHLSTFYPRQWVLPDGTVLKVANRAVHQLNTVNWSWTVKPSLSRLRSGGPAGMLLPGGPTGSSQVLMAGGLSGANTATNTTEKFDLATSRWTAGNPMPNGRAHMSLVQVPDGSAFGIGGNTSALFDQPQRQTLRYDPKTDLWSGMATQGPRRGYHSTAVLLPDGRIMSAGDTGAGGGRQLVDFYSPPYLYAASRPAIASAPSQVDHGASFPIGTAENGVRAVLMAPGAATHANDMQARHVELAVQDTPEGLIARAPSPNVAPPGYYMLFVLDAAGVPSVATWVHVGPAVPTG